MKTSKAAIYNLLSIVGLFFASGILNNLLFSAFPETNFYFFFSSLAAIAVFYLFSISDFRGYKFVIFVYLGLLIIAFSKVSIFAKTHLLLNNQLIIVINFIGVLIIALTYWFYLFSCLGLKSFFSFKFWFVVAEILLAGLMFPFLAGYASRVQLTWISFFSLILLLVILIEKIKVRRC